tara:strand:- start:3425 stop:3709 length:285 start_codon:yes stop_codon:yes gene_type:complete
MDEKIEKIIFNTIDNINSDLGVNIEKSIESDIIGGESPLDSLGVISFLMELESNVETSLDVDITLVNDDVLSEDNNPLKNVGTIIDHLKKIIKI